MTQRQFFIATDAQDAEFLLYGDPAKGMERGTFDVVTSRRHMDQQNLMLWRPLVAATTGEWPVCDVWVCDHENRRHEGGCRTNLGINFGGGA